MYDYEDEEDDLFGPPPQSPSTNTKKGINFEKELNGDQFCAVTAADGPALVLAGAGSGKTRTLTYRVAYLLEQGVPPEAILLLTFTNKASRQMLERVEQLTGVGSHRFLGGTFHHVGGQALRLFGELIGLPRSFTILDDGDSDSLLNEVIREIDSEFFKSKENPKAKPIKGLISYARNVGKNVEEVASARYPANRELISGPVFVQSFDEDALRRLRNEFETEFPLVRLLGAEEAEALTSEASSIDAIADYASGVGLPFETLIAPERSGGSLQPSDLARMLGELEEGAARKDAREFHAQYCAGMR